MYKIVCILLLSMLITRSFAQELNIRVEVQSPQVQNTNKRALEVLQKAISDFLNNRAWTANKVQNEERIDGALVITITSWDGSKEFKGTAQVFPQDLCMVRITIVPYWHLMTSILISRI